MVGEAGPGADRLRLPGLRGGLDDPHRGRGAVDADGGGDGGLEEGREGGEVRGVTFWRVYGYVQGAGGYPWEWEEVDETRE